MLGEGTYELCWASSDWLRAPAYPVRRSRLQSAQTSGVRVEQRLYEVYTLRTGRILRVDEFSDRAEALEAVGLRE